MTILAQVQSLLRSCAMEKLSGGSFNETVRTPDGLQITYQFPWATGMAWQAKQFSYLKRFGAVPMWVHMLHPNHRLRLCDLALDERQNLPEALGDGPLQLYLAEVQALRGVQVEQKISHSSGISKVELMSKQDDVQPVTEFEVHGSKTLWMADFVERKIRSEFYEAVSEWWSKSPAHLADAMDECQPLAWAVHSLYTEVRDDIQSDLEGVMRRSGTFEKRAYALKKRLFAMPEEPEEGVQDWLLTLTQVEFEQRIVPSIKKWFASPPDWNWEDDHLPRDGTAQGAALEFFKNMDGDALDILGVTIVEGAHPGSTYYAAELMKEIDAANKAADAAGIPVRFKKCKG